MSVLPLVDKQVLLSYLERDSSLFIKSIVFQTARKGMTSGDTVTFPRMAEAEIAMICWFAAYNEHIHGSQYGFNKQGK